MKVAEMLEGLFAKGWKQDELASELKTTQPTISRWRKGAEAKADARDKLRELSIREGVLREPKRRAPAGSSKKTRNIPLISWVSAGKLSGSEVPANVRAEDRIVISGLAEGQWIALRVKGDSMNLIAPDSSVIFVDVADKRLVEDRFYVFGQENGDSTFKRYRGGRNPRLQPYSTNPDHETIPTTDALHVIGRVKRTMLDL